ncbi:hypothetical protein HJB79_08795 [Rhizobium lentis]|uniref:hypothetical protein n=1 Tax=Rhizobium lentis TaxID=1138194 RepID=UPI001C830B3B|nr:hypothetical protein [Rhizobium lentis]MBX5132045.1 hypothetical protein [Rhizobium lentis]MBX5138895.1 hypothetical protein [Rhizobium lentis]MBX5150981.1 hypothetical protein [Rhizobium lentis]MBX5176135.1 hypothetical protein [Rhizobium lentis]
MAIFSAAQHFMVGFDFFGRGAPFGLRSFSSTSSMKARHIFEATGLNGIGAELEVAHEFTDRRDLGDVFLAVAGNGCR